MTWFTNWPEWHILTPTDTYLHVLTFWQPIITWRPNWKKRLPTKEIVKLNVAGAPKMTEFWTSTNFCYFFVSGAQWKMFDFEKIFHFICSLQKKSLWKSSKRFEWIPKKFKKVLKWKFSIRFDGKIIWYLRFESTFFIYSKNSSKINSKFIWFDSTP